MVLVNYSAKEINAKVVYYGPGLCGKTTNLEFIYGRVPQTNRGKMVSMKTRTERTLFFDFLPLNLGDLAGFQTRFLLYTVPGQIYYNATRKLVLKGVDALVFVADSGRGMMEENLESFQNLRDNLREHGLALEDVPLVLQYNKRDLPDVYSIDELEHALNPTGAFPHYEAVATSGQGVFETFKGVARLLLAHLAKKMGIQQAATAEVGADPSAMPEMPRAAAPAPAASRPTPPPALSEQPAAPKLRSAPIPGARPESPAPSLDLSGPRAQTGQRPQPSARSMETDLPPAIHEPSVSSAEDLGPETRDVPASGAIERFGDGARLQQGASSLLGKSSEPAPERIERFEPITKTHTPISTSLDALTLARGPATLAPGERRTITIPITLEASDVENGFILELRVEVTSAVEVMRRAS